MNVDRSRAHIYLYTSDIAFASEVIRRALRTQGYVRLGRAPQVGYPRQALEVKEFFIDESDSDGPTHVIIEDFDQVFFWCLALSTAEPTLPVMGLGKLQGMPFRLKLYHAKTPVFKVGEDPDHELFYPVSLAGQREWDRAMELIPGGRKKTASTANDPMVRMLQTPSGPPITELARSFRLRDTDLAFSTMKEKPSSPFRYACWVRSDSPLLDLNP